MTSRYGRNKRREHRQRIEALEGSLSSAEYQIKVAERRISTAMEEGMNRILSVRHLPEVCDRIGVELARAYGPEVAAVAKKIMSSNHEHRMPIDLSGSVSFDQNVTVIRGRIKELNFNVAVQNF